MAKVKAKPYPPIATRANGIKDGHPHEGPDLRGYGHGGNGTTDTAGGGFLRGATASGLGLMAGVTAELGRAAIVDPFTAALAVAAFAVLRRTQVAPLLILAGGLAGIAAKALVG